ncbi:MAG TPA: group 1 truncated hemoglobin [Gemmatimonadales bacterium]|nr:group 1 truncated hemoglobin [Gemmatimonadales bacterium]
MRIRNGFWLCIAPVVAVILGSAFTPRVVTAQQAEQSLYERLGRAYPIAVVVDEFLNRLIISEMLNANPAIAAARARVPMPGLKYHVTALVCQATGGPCTYTGRTMRQAHAHLNISEREWQEMLRVFRGVLDHFKVPAREQQELIAIVESTKADIVLSKL